METSYRRDVRLCAKSTAILRGLAIENPQLALF